MYRRINLMWWIMRFAVLTWSLFGSLGVTQTGNTTLKQVADVPLPGRAVRFDYQSLDAEHGRLYIAHMNADQLVVFDTASRQVVANLDGFKRIHGVLAVPEIDRVYASVTGDHEVVAVDMRTLKMVATAGPVNYPDGLAYSPSTRRVFVSDEHGDSDAVVDSVSGKLLATIRLGGGAGNTVYDAGSGHILVAVHGVNELDAIDPVAMRIIATIHCRESEIRTASHSTPPRGWLSLQEREITRWPSSTWQA